MARITVEDCVNKVSSKFELVVLAALRAKDINSGAQITVNRDSDKDSVIALREIAVGNVSVDSLKKNLIDRLNSRPIDRVEDENLHVDDVEVGDFEYLPEEVSLDEDFSMDFEDADLSLEPEEDKNL